MLLHLPRSWRRVSEILRWRGVGYFLLLALRELLRPILYWYAWNIYRTDLDRSIGEPYAKGKFDVKIFRGEAQREAARAELAKVHEPLPADFDARIRRGDAVAVVFSGDEAVAAGWMTFASGMELAFGTNWILQPGEGTQYGSFVSPKWRGQGIFSVLNVTLNRYAQEAGVTRSIGSISVLNTQSLSMARRLGKKKIMTVVLVRLRGVNWTFRTALGAPLDSRFTAEPRPKARLIRQPLKP
jgi:GNAT superfamily N-acetyltransferase